MEMEFWEEVEKIGKLYVEEELVVGIEPVLQVCVDQQKYNRYLVMTYDSGEGEFVLCRIEPKALLDMLENRKTMEETFRSAGRIYMTSALTDELLQAVSYEADKFPADRLPDKGAYYDISSEYIKRYVEKLKNSQDFVRVEMEMYKTIAKISMSLSESVRKPDIRYNLGCSNKKEFRADHINIDMDNNRYLVNESAYFAA